MPTTEHDIIGRFFRQHPAFAAQLLTGLLGLPLPAFDEARCESVDFTDVKPTPFVADAAVALIVRRGRDGAPSAAEATTPAAAGSGRAWTRQHPELAVLSARVHGHTPEAGTVFAALLAALKEVDRDDARLYYELVLDGLEPWAQDLLKELTTVTAVIPNDPRAVHLRRLVEGAWSEGEARGEARAVLAFLAARHIDVPDEARDRISACTDLDELETWVRRAATATTVKDLFE